MDTTTVNKTENHFASPKLTEALNLICLYVADRLPEDWEIVLRMSHREATLDLLDEHGTDHSSEASTGDGCALVELCDYALEVEAADIAIPVVLLDGLAEIAYNANGGIAELAYGGAFNSWDSADSVVKAIHEDIAKAVAVEVLRRIRDAKPSEQAPAVEAQPAESTQATANVQDQFITVGSLKSALAALPDDMPIFDCDYESGAGCPYSHISQILQVEDVAELDFHSLGKAFHFGRRDGLLEHTVLREFKVLSI